MPKRNANDWNLEDLLTTLKDMAVNLRDITRELRRRIHKLQKERDKNHE